MTGLKHSIQLLEVRSNEQYYTLDHVTGSIGESVKFKLVEVNGALVTEVPNVMILHSGSYLENTREAFDYCALKTLFWLQQVGNSVRITGAGSRDDPPPNMTLQVVVVDFNLVWEGQEGFV